MKCPTCPDVTLVMSDRQGIEIDYCPTCRGVWLDRGELDKIVERSLVTAGPAPAPSTERGRDDGRDRDDRRDREDDWRAPEGKPKKKRSSFLSEIFEFGE